MEEQETMDDWNPELGYLPKKDIVGKEHITRVEGRFTEKDGKRTIYKIETWDTTFGNRQLQLNVAQARYVKELIFPTIIIISAKQEGEYKNKPCYKLLLKNTEGVWI